MLLVVDFNLIKTTLLIKIKTKFMHFAFELINFVWCCVVVIFLYLFLLLLCFAVTLR